MDKGFPSPHSGILFLFQRVEGGCSTLFGRFRPLIRGFFFYFNTKLNLEESPEEVSVPSFGDSFFINSILQDVWVYTPCFRPLIRGFFFYYRKMSEKELADYSGFRPLIRGFFFYKSHKRLNHGVHILFPSPHSGILFLYCRYDMPPSLNIFAIFRRILHFLAQKGSPLTQSIHFSPYPSASARIKSFFHPYCTVSNSS